MANLPSVISPTTLAMVVDAPNSVSRLLGKLDVSRHLTVSLVCWAKAGDAASAAAPAAAIRARYLRVTSVMASSTFGCSVWRKPSTRFAATAPAFYTERLCKERLSQGHFTSGGMEERIESTLPPV